jgi:hypothetical protein
LGTIWQDIVDKTKEKELKEFSGAVLVAISEWGYDKQHSETATISESEEGTLKRLAMLFEREMDMNFVPLETLEITMTKKFGVQ